MEWLIVLMLILIGAILVVLEILVLPGINVAGILGFISIIAGVYFGYAYYGRSGGPSDFGGYGCLRLRDDLVCPSDKNLEKAEPGYRLEGTVEGIGDSVKAGDCGETLGRLAPMGNVKLGDMVVEAESRSGYIDAHRPVEVVKVLRNKVIVQLKTV